MAASDSRVSAECEKIGTVKGKQLTDGSFTEIIIVRHGETDWNASGKMQGQLDVDLNEVGRRQAAAVAERLPKEPNISAIYSSDLKRAPETAEVIAAKRDGLEGGGESCDQLYKRCTSSVQRIVEKNRGQRVIIVTHGGFIRSLYIRGANKRRSAGKFSNTSISIIQVSDRDVWSIKSWNDVNHLKETGFLKSAFGGDSAST